MARPIHLVTVAGPPAVGKTSVLLKALRSAGSLHCGVAKFDCLNSLDARRYREAGIPALAGIAGNLCPDHYFVTNIENCLEWAQSQELDMLLVESAGLCNRCAPHIREQMAVCVLDCLSGIDTPLKTGPMLKLADMVLLTKADLVSQAEREVFRYRVRQINTRASVRFVNGLNGQGCDDLVTHWTSGTPCSRLEGSKLRFPMPTAVCSYCLGETRIGKERQIGILKSLETP